MADITVQSRIVFWALVAVFAALAAAPSVVLLENARRYLKFLSAWDPGALKAFHTRRVPHRDPLQARRKAPELHFVPFHLRARKAKKVFLAGDFNGWEPEKLPLLRSGSDAWEVLIALPAGKYRYLFRVDGAWTTDPSVPTRDRYGQLETSVRQVP